MKAAGLFFPEIAIAHSNPVEMLWRSLTFLSPLFLASDSAQLSVWGTLIFSQKADIGIKSLFGNSSVNGSPRVEVLTAK